MVRWEAAAAHAELCDDTRCRRLRQGDVREKPFPSRRRGIGRLARYHLREISWVAGARGADGDVVRGHSAVGLVHAGALGTGDVVCAGGDGSVKRAFPTSQTSENSPSETVWKS